jgi:hypothetical protein
VLGWLAPYGPGLAATIVVQHGRPDPPKLRGITDAIEAYETVRGPKGWVEVDRSQPHA